MLPKKGSAEYEAVKKLQSETEMGPEHEVKKRGRKSAEAMGGKIAKGEIKGKKAPTPQGASSEVTSRAGDDLVPPRVNTTSIDPQEGKKGVKKVVAKTISKPKQEKAIQRDGLTKAAEEAEIMTNRNTGPGATVSAQLPGQKDMIKAELKEAKKQVKAKVQENPPEETIDNMKTDDPKAIEGKAPFSILALRKKLLA